MLGILSSDIKRNKGNTKGLLIVICYRLARMLHLLSSNNIILKIFAFPFFVTYKILLDYIMGIYIPYATNIGPGLTVYHGVGIVINPKSVIGNNCTIRQNVTIGSKDENDSECPRIGNNVNIGAGAIIIGNISIGDNSVVGAGAVVTKNIASGSIVVGNPAKVVS